jgi:hypothetical protein
MSTIEIVPDLYRAVPPGTHGYEISLEVQSGVARLTISGSLDESAADALTGIFGCTDEMNCTIRVFADGVTAADPRSIDPLIHTASLRASRDMSPVVIETASDVVRDLLGRFGGGLEVSGLDVSGLDVVMKEMS